MIAIVGAGVSGLCLGYYLKKSGFHDFTIFSEENEIGGKMKTSTFNGFNLESGPNTLMTTPLLLELIYELGLEEELIYPDESIVKNRFIKINGKTTALPQKPQQLLFNGLLSLSSKLSILKDLRIKPNTLHETENVSEFFNRHFSSEIVDKLVTPFCRGIYATEPEGLTLKTTFPKLAEIEKKYGSVVKGLKKTQSLEKRKVFLLKNGMKSIISSLNDFLKDHILKEKVTKIEHHLNSYKVHTINNSQDFNKIVFSCPAHEAGDLISSISPETSKTLNRIEKAQLNVQHRVYDLKNNKFPFNGFGVLYTKNESNQILGHIWNSSINNQNPNQFLITTMFRGESNDEFNNSLDSIFKSDYGLEKNDLIHTNLTLWKRAIPIYNKRHLEFLEQYERETKINLYFCSNLVGGVSIPDRVKQAKELATKLL